MKTQSLKSGQSKLTFGTSASPTGYREMPRYYIHLDNGHGHQTDNDGAIFSDASYATEEAVRSGAHILADELKLGYSSVKLTLHIEDADRQPITAVSMSGTIYNLDRSLN